MRYVKFERTPEYQEKYRKPLDKAYEAAARAIAGIKIQDADGNEVREAKIDDIYSLVQIPSEAQADEAAIALFGKHARTAMKHRDNIVSRIEAMREAQDEWRTKGSERETQMKEEGERATKQFQKWTEEKQRDLAEAAPDYFGEPKDDPEAAALVEKSSAIVDIALGRAKFKDGMSSEDQAKARAEAIGHVVSRARNFGRLVRSNQKLSDENAELKEKLKGYEKSEPTPTPSTAKQEKAPKTPYDALAELAEERH
jgi:regulator of replication initiation timing